MSKRTITKEHVENLMLNSSFEVSTLGNKTTIAILTLPNGFVLVETSSCVSPENYDEELGKQLCLKKIEDKIWAFEGYLLQDKVHEETTTLK